MPGQALDAIDLLILEELQQNARLTRALHREGLKLA